MLSNVGGGLSNVGCSVMWGCSVPWGGYLEYRAGTSVPWRDIMVHVGDIMSTVGVFSTVGRALKRTGFLETLQYDATTTTAVLS